PLFFFTLPRPPPSPLFPYTTLFRSGALFTVTDAMAHNLVVGNYLYAYPTPSVGQPFTTLIGVLATRGMVSNLEPRSAADLVAGPDRKSTRLNSSHLGISYAVFCLKK